MAPTLLIGALRWVCGGESHPWCRYPFLKQCRSDKIYKTPRVARDLSILPRHQHALELPDTPSCFYDNSDLAIILIIGFFLSPVIPRITCAMVVIARTVFTISVVGSTFLFLRAPHLFYTLFISIA